MGCSLNKKGEERSPKAPGIVTFAILYPTSFYSIVFFSLSFEKNCSQGVLTYGLLAVGFF